MPRIVQYHCAKCDRLHARQCTVTAWPWQSVCNTSKDTTDRVNAWLKGLFHTSEYQIKVILIPILPIPTKTLPTLFGCDWVYQWVNQREIEREKDVGSVVFDPTVSASAKVTLKFSPLPTQLQCPSPHPRSCHRLLVCWMQISWPWLRTFSRLVFQQLKFLPGISNFEPRINVFSEQKPYVALRKGEGGWLVGWGSWAPFWHVCHGKKITVPLGGLSQNSIQVWKTQPWSQKLCKSEIFVCARVE